MSTFVFVALVLGAIVAVFAVVGALAFVGMRTAEYYWEYLPSLGSWETPLTLPAFMFSGIDTTTTQE